MSLEPAAIGQALNMHAIDHKNRVPLCGYLWTHPPQYPGSTPQGMSDSAQQYYSYWGDPGRGGRAVLAPLPFVLAQYLGKPTPVTSLQDFMNSNAMRIFTCPSNIDQVQASGVGSGFALEHCTNPAPPFPELRHDVRPHGRDAYGISKLRRSATKNIA